MRAGLLAAEESVRSDHGHHLFHRRLAGRQTGSDGTVPPRHPAAKRFFVVPKIHPYARADGIRTWFARFDCWILRNNPARAGRPRLQQLFRP